MQRHAVHGRRHAVLAHAVVDEAAGEIGRRDRRHRLGLGVVRAGEVGRAADHLRQRRGQGIERVLGCHAGGDLLGLLRELLLHRPHSPVERARKIAPNAALELGAALGCKRSEALVPFLARVL